MKIIATQGGFEMNEKCIWNINPETIPLKECGKEAKWEVGFSFMVQDAFMHECSGKNEYQGCFCDEHFIGLSGCGNVVEFRRIGVWLDFDDVDNPNLLKDLTDKYKDFKKVLKERYQELSKWF